MPMYNLLEYSKNYRKIIGSLYNYYRDELTNDQNDNFANINVINLDPFQYKNKLLDNTYNVDSTRVPDDGGARENNPNYNGNLSGTSNIILAIPLKYLGNFWRALNILSISCEIFLELKILAFFDLLIKTEEEAYEKIIDISRNNEYTTGNLLDYDYFKKHYKLIAIDLSKQQVLQENEDLIQQINFIGRLENAANVFIIIEKKENTILEFSQNFANVIY